MSLERQGFFSKQRRSSRTELWRELLQLAWPLVVANSFWNIQLTIDRMFLGQYSTGALAAAIGVMGVYWTPMALLQQTAAYLMTFVAQYYGANEHHKIGPAVWQAIYISVIGGLLFLGLIPCAGPLFRLMGHSPELRELEVQFFQALCYGALPTALVAVASSFYSGLGMTRMVIGMNAIGLIVNVGFDYLLIFGHGGFPALGIQGAGYATALASWASALYGLFLIFQKKYELSYGLRRAWRWQRDLMYRYLRYGLPSGLQWALEGLAFTAFLVLVGRMKQGEVALASSSIAVTVMMLAALPVMGMAQAASIRLGQCLGDSQPEKAEAFAYGGLQISLVYITITGLSFLLFPGFYLSWFENSSSALLWDQVKVVVPYILRCVALFVCFDCINLIFSFALRGAGDTRFVSAVALSLPWPLMVLPTWWVKDWEASVYWSWAFVTVFVIIQALVFLFRFRQGKWKSMSVIHSPH